MAQSARGNGDEMSVHTLEVQKGDIRENGFGICKEQTDDSVSSQERE